MGESPPGGGPSRERQRFRADVVQVHPSLLAQLLDNLLENACKYSEPGTPVVVRSWHEGGSVSLSVEDRGRGLAADELANVFEPFFRGETARREGHAGVGLGLAVARRIAATFGGTLDVRSEPGVGSLFILRLPAAAVPGHERRRSARDRVGVLRPPGGAEFVKDSAAPEFKIDNSMILSSFNVYFELSILNSGF